MQRIYVARPFSSSQHQRNCLAPQCCMHQSVLVWGSTNCWNQGVGKEGVGGSGPVSLLSIVTKTTQEVRLRALEGLFELTQCPMSIMGPKPNTVGSCLEERKRKVFSQ